VNKNAQFHWSYVVKLTLTRETIYDLAISVLQRTLDTITRQLILSLTKKICNKYSASQKELKRLIFGHNAGKCIPIFNILSLSDSQRNFACTQCTHYKEVPPHLKCATTLPCCSFEQGSGPVYLDPYAEAFLWQAHCANPGGESGRWCVRVHACLKGEEGLSRHEQLCQVLVTHPF